MTTEVDPLIQSVGRSIPTPVIRHDEEAELSSKWWYGNTAITPNTGLTNSYEYSICGAIHESIQQLRAGLVCLTLATLFCLFWSVWWHLFTLQWIRLVLSLYLGFLAGLLCLADAFLLTTSSSFPSSMVPGDDDVSVSSANSPALPHARQYLHQNFGFLYHPIGRPCLLIFMATLCWILGGLIVFLLGCCYFVVAVVVVYLGKESEFRREYYPEFLEEEAANINPMPPAQYASWASIKNTMSQAIQR